MSTLSGVGSITNNKSEGKSVPEFEYWEGRYKRGHSSGAGALGYQKIWKWRVITSHVKPVDNVIDVGCGDLRFWAGRGCQAYLGIDISPTVIKSNREKRPTWKFICGDVCEYIEGITAPIVFCLDVVYHIMNEERVPLLLRNLCRYSTDLIFIYTTFQNTGGATHIRYHDVDKYLDIFSQFELQEKKPLGKGNVGMYVFRRLKGE